MENYTGKEAWKNFDLKDNEMEFRLIDAGKVISYTDGTYNFVETGKKLTMKRHDFFGLEFVLCSNKIYEVGLAIEVHFPDGTEEETTMTIKNNVPQMICQGFLSERYMMDGEWMLRVQVKDRIYDEQGEEVTVFGDFQEEFKLKCIRPESRLATEEDIKNVEATYNTKLNEDFISYLKSHNGYDFDWSEHRAVEEEIKMVGEEEIEKIISGQVLEEVGDWKNDVTELFGANTEKHTNLVSPNGETIAQFYDVAFGPFFYPVGVDKGGNPMVQIAAGKHRGKIGMMDHEVFYGGMDILLNLTEETIDEYEVPFKDLGSVDADVLIDYCSESGYLAVLDEDFGTYFQTRKAVTEAKIDVIKKTFGAMTGNAGDGTDVFAGMDFDFDEADLKKAGSFKKDGDGYALVEKGKKVSLGSEETVGVQFKIKSKKDDKQLAKCSITDPGGNTTESDMMVAPNSTATLAYSKFGDAAEKGEYAFKIKFPNNEMLDTLKKKIKVK